MRETRPLNTSHAHGYFSTLLVFCFLFITVGPTHSSEKLDEKRSCIQSVDGYSYIAEDKTIADLRTAAMNNAKQQALSNATTYIKSRTEVENFVLVSDEVLINAEGTVKILEQIDHGIQDNSRYHIWIKAEVEYLLGEGTSSSSPAPVTMPAATQIKSPSTDTTTAPLTVRLWSPKQNYTSGEKIEIFLQGNRDFYARVVDINSQGDIVQLLPNSYRTTSFFQGGETYKIPGDGDQFDLTVSAPFGKDKVVVYASEVPLGTVDMQSIGQGLNLYSGDQSSLSVRTRGISVTSKKQATATPAIAEFYEASYEITTTR